MARKPKQPPKPRYRLVADDTNEGQEIRSLLKDLIGSVNQHRDLKAAKIAPAWMIGQKADRDGRVKLGAMKKASELERQLHGFDAILLLNQDYWRTMTPEQRRALVDHELCHLAPSLDPKTLDQREDAHGRKLWRIRRHDLEEFRAVVERHGCYLDDIRRFVDAAEESKRTPLFPAESPRPTPVPRSTKRKGNGAEEVAATA